MFIEQSTGSWSRSSVCGEWTPFAWRFPLMDFAETTSAGMRLHMDDTPGAVLVPLIRGWPEHSECSRGWVFRIFQTNILVASSGFADRHQKKKQLRVVLFRDERAAICGGIWSISSNVHSGRYSTNGWSTKCVLRPQSRVMVPTWTPSRYPRMTNENSYCVGYIGTNHWLREN